MKIAESQGHSVRRSVPSRPGKRVPKCSDTSHRPDVKKDLEVQEEESSILTVVSIKERKHPVSRDERTTDSHSR